MSSSLSESTSKSIERNIEEQNPDERIVSVVVEINEPRNDEEKLNISVDNAVLNSGKSIEYRHIEIDRNEESHGYLRGVEVPRESPEKDIVRDYSFDKNCIWVSLDRNIEKDKPLDIRLERDLSEKIFNIYDRAMDVARDREDLRYYSTHTLPHIECVTITACSVGERLGLRDEESQREIVMAAVSHDLGMAGLPRDDTKIGLTRSDLLTEEKEVFRAKTDNDGNVKLNIDGKPIMEDVRSYHPIASAIEVIRNSELFEERGVNPGHIALEAILHSKSSSGTTNLDDPRDIYKQITRIDEDLDKLDLKTDKTERIISDLRDMFSIKEDGKIEINPDRMDELNQIKTVAIAVTIGDAFSHSHGTIEENLSQSGMIFDVRNTDAIYDPRTVDLEDYMKRVDSISPAEEMKGMEVFVIDPDSGREIDSKIMDGERMDASFILGESNLSYDLHSVVSRNDEQKIVVTCEIQDAKFSPASTYFAAEERIREFPRVHFYGSKDEEARIEINFTIKDIDKLSDKERESISKFYDIKMQETTSKINCPHITITKNF